MSVLSVVEGWNVFVDALLDLGEVGTYNFVLPFAFLNKSQLTSLTK